MAEHREDVRPLLMRNRRGHNRERAIRKLLANKGFWVARAAGSFGDADLVALKSGTRPYLLEVKSTAGGPYEHFGPAARRELSEAARIAGARAGLYWWPPRGDPQWIPESEWPT